MIEIKLSPPSQTPLFQTFLKKSEKKLNMESATKELINFSCYMFCFSGPVFGLHLKKTFVLAPLTFEHN